MKVTLDIHESHYPFFIELVKSLKYVKVLNETKEKAKNNLIKDLSDAFNDVALYEQGKKKLKTAEELLNEL